jgi:hypothetical protein
MCKTEISNTQQPNKALLELARETWHEKLIDSGIVRTIGDNVSDEDGIAAIAAALQKAVKNAIVERDQEHFRGTKGISEATSESAIHAACFPATTENKTKQVQVLPPQPPATATLRPWTHKINQERNQVELWNGDRCIGRFDIHEKQQIKAIAAARNNEAKVALQPWTEETITEIFKELGYNDDFLPTKRVRQAIADARNNETTLPRKPWTAEQIREIAGKWTNEIVDWVVKSIKTLFPVSSYDCTCLRKQVLYCVTHAMNDTADLEHAHEATLPRGEPWNTLQAICGMTDVREIHLAADIALASIRADATSLPTTQDVTEHAREYPVRADAKIKCTHPVEDVCPMCADAGEREQLYRMEVKEKPWGREKIFTPVRDAGEDTKRLDLFSARAAMNAQEKNVAWVLPRPKPDKYKGGMPLYAEKWLLNLARKILDSPNARVLNLFCGMNKEGFRVDIKPEVFPDLVADAHSFAGQLNGQKFAIVLADPPYSNDESRQLYGTGKLNYKKWTAEADKVLIEGGLLLVYHKLLMPNPNPDKYVVEKRVFIGNRTLHAPRVCVFFRKKCAAMKGKKE